MSKRLKIQFWKAEKALAMQILEQEGLPKDKCEGFVKTDDTPTLGLEEICLRGSQVIYNSYIDSVYFKSDAERDAYLGKIVNAITDELFTGNGELKVGELCEVRDYEFQKWVKRKLLAVLPEQYQTRFIVENIHDSNLHVSMEYARPLTKRTEPTVEECGQLITYTWEEK